MGKRELLLIAGFIIAGVIVYQVTAPPSSPGSGFSPSRVLAEMRRAIHGDRGRAEITHSTAYPITAEISEIRLSGPIAEITVQGEDRQDISSDLRIASTGFDDADAKRLAEESVMQVDNAGTSLNLQAIYPEQGRQTGYVTLKVPKRLRVRIDEARGRTLISDVAGAELGNSRGDTTLKQIAGRATIAHRGGRVIVEQVESLKLASRAGANTRITGIGGDLSLDLQGGELQAAGVKGSIDAELRSGAELTLKADDARGPIRINANGGSVTVENVKGDLRVDGRNTEVSVTVAEGAPTIAVYEEGGEDVHVTPPPGGYRLDAVAMNGRVTLPANTVTVTTNGAEQRATGVVKGGGATTITVRSRDGDIIVRGR